MASPRNPPANPSLTDWLNAVMIIVTGISGIGLLLAAIGLYLLKNDLLLLIGACVVTAAFVAWGGCGRPADLPHNKAADQRFR